MNFFTYLLSDLDCFLPLLTIYSLVSPVHSELFYSVSLIILLYKHPFVLEHCTAQVNNHTALFFQQLILDTIIKHDIIWHTNVEEILFPRLMRMARFCTTFSNKLIINSWKDTANFESMGHFLIFINYLYFLFLLNMQ